MRRRRKKTETSCDDNTASSIVNDQMGNGSAYSGGTLPVVQGVLADRTVGNTVAIVRCLLPAPEICGRDSAIVLYTI